MAIAIARSTKASERFDMMPPALKSAIIVNEASTKLATANKLGIGS